MTPETRETETLDVKGHQVVVNSFLTGRDMREIQTSMYADLQLKQKGLEQEMTGISGKTIVAREDAQIKAVIVSIDGNTDVVNALLDLREDAYEAILAVVKEKADPKVEPDSDKVS